MRNALARVKNLCASIKAGRQTPVSTGNPETAERLLLVGLHPNGWERIETNESGHGR
jgi:hypothetical protein